MAHIDLAALKAAAEKAEMTTCPEGHPIKAARLMQLPTSTVKALVAVVEAALRKRAAAFAEPLNADELARATAAFYDALAPFRGASDGSSL